MWTVYVLRCADGTHYVGMTGDMERRLSEHRRGLNRWTRTRLPVELVHQEQLPTRVAARAREKALKSGWSKRRLVARLGLR